MVEIESRRERLHKVLARAGIASRRDCEDLIRQGRVRVDGVVATIGQSVDIARQDVRCDDQPVRVDKVVAYLVYKPKGVVCTTKDQFQRRSVVDLVPNPRGQRLFPVGRLEEDSEGLLVVTNDGELAHRLVDRRSGSSHTYFVKVRGPVPQEALEKARQGVWLSDGKSAPMTIRVTRQGKEVSSLIVTPAAQQHRLLRRVFARVGLAVERIIRTRFGPLGTADLGKSTCRRLSAAEIERLRNPEREHQVSVVMPKRKVAGSSEPTRPTRRGPPTKGKGRPTGRPPRRPTESTSQREDARSRRRVVGP